MTNTITTYKDLLDEKERLTLLLRRQKEIVKHDFAEIKEELKPVQHAISTIGKFATKDKSNWLLTGAADMIIDIVVKKLFLARAGWLTKLAVPFIAKNYSSHFLADKKDKIFGKLFSLFSKKHSNGEAMAMSDEMDDEDE